MAGSSPAAGPAEREWKDCSDDNETRNEKPQFIGTSRRIFTLARTVIRMRALKRPGPTFARKDSNSALYI
jgi:hypothetical protein